MTSTVPLQHSDSSDSSDSSGETVRVSFRQPVSVGGFVDAAWWPRSRDLSQELPPLLELMWTAGRDITRVTYHAAEWGPAPRQLRVEGRRVRLGGFSYGDPLLIGLSDAWGRERVDLLVLAPETDAGVAAAAFDLAATAGGTLRPAELLAQAGAAR
jgi:hypothetical protein